MNKVAKPIITSTFAIAFAALSLGAQAAESFNAERGPDFAISSQSLSRAEVANELAQARAAGQIVRGEIYPDTLMIKQADNKTFAAAQRELGLTSLMRAEAARTGANGYTPG